MAKTKSSKPKTFSFINVTKHKDDLRKKEPPLVDIEVSNPLTYLKAWWKRVIGNEGIDLRFRIRPLTAIAISVVVAVTGFGIGRFALSMKKPYISYVPVSPPQPTPIPTISPWRNTAFSGELVYVEAENRYYLLTTNDEAISLFPEGRINLSELVGEQIFATGRYQSRLRQLYLTSISVI